MKVLVIGSGGRENTIAWKIKQSPLLDELYIAPGNPGTAKLGTNVPISVSDIDALRDFALEHKIDLTVVGPEDPLVHGVVDVFQAAGLKIFGPDSYAAQMEGSKDFAKEVMEKAGVPTAAYQTFTDRESAFEFLKSHKAPLVIKADGLAAGKGVFVCMSDEEARAGLEEVFTRFNGTKVVIEEYLDGKEASYIVATDGERIVPFARSNDYKRVFDDDKGPNTGGMGTISPTPNLSAEQETWVLENVMYPVIKELAKRGHPYCGFLYAGLMVSGDKINVLEFNARLGDPETQVILRRLEGDLLALLWALVNKDQNLPKISTSKKSALCLVLASEGYPNSPKKGDKISGLEEFDNDEKIVIFHAGTKVQDGDIVTAGGRVLCVTALDDNLDQAREDVYQATKKISFRGMHYRKDIGKH